MRLSAFSCGKSRGFQDFFKSKVGSDGVENRRLRRERTGGALLQRWGPVMVDQAGNGLATIQHVGFKML